jgi:hypothetical protein
MTIAPATSRLIARIAPLLGVKPDPTRDVNMTAMLGNLDDKVEE